jgi:hypothetical protein
LVAPHPRGFGKAEYWLRNERRTIGSGLALRNDALRVEFWRKNVCEMQIYVPYLRVYGPVDILHEMEHVERRENRETQGEADGRNNRAEHAPFIPSRRWKRRGGGQVAQSRANLSPVSSRRPPVFVTVPFLSVRRVARLKEDDRV